MFQIIKEFIHRDPTLYILLRIRWARFLFLGGMFLYFSSLLLRQNQIATDFFGPIAFFTFPLLLLFAAHWAYWNIRYLVLLYAPKHNWILVLAIVLLLIIVGFGSYLHTQLWISSLLVSPSAV